ncbi:MEDS domain-containing protein [Streptomyces minutiscleroticus]|uniref:MEDS domain-containing protein n=1 Tax=Streptomyces minutiscleroticus TaxID=68238 RepID=UPI0033343838
MMFDDQACRWQVRAAYVEQGLARGEQVVLYTDPATTVYDVMARFTECGPAVDSALAAGQLLVCTEIAGFDPRRGLDPDARIRFWLELTTRASTQGFTGVRIMADMGWAAGPGVDHDVLVEYESRLSAVLADINLTAVCEYDQRLFDEHLLQRIGRAHPKKVLSRLDALEFTRVGTQLWAAGEADLTTRDAFDTTLADALTGLDRITVLDLCELCFMDGHSARTIVRLAHRRPASQLLTIRCLPIHNQLLRLSNASAIPHLVVQEECFAP